jgi:S-adenosylmethionine/arginine decarboxylase-like enzyme
MSHDEQGWILKNSILDLYNCDNQQLSDEKFVLDLTERTKNKLLMKTCIQPNVEKTSIGLTCRIGLKESHAIVNTFPTGNTAYIIISTCKDFNHDEITENLKEELGARSYEVITTKYKIPEGPHKILSHKTHRMSPLRKGDYYDHVLGGKRILAQFLCYVPLYETLGKDKKKEFFEWFSRRGEKDPSTKKVYKFKPQGETGIFYFRGVSSPYHTWPELDNFMVMHIQDFRWGIFMDQFFYTWHPHIEI